MRSSSIERGTYDVLRYTIGGIRLVSASLPRSRAEQIRGERERERDVWEVERNDDDNQTTL